MKILFLTNNIISQPLVNWLRDVAKEEVIVYDKNLSKIYINKVRPDFVISYNYNHIIKKEILDLLPKKVINLHISLLPYNRSAHPNVWSFLEDSPKGVSIHLIDEGIDTGDILLQRKVKFKEENETSASSYKKLHKEIQDLFKKKWCMIKSFRIRPKPQPIGGSIHYKKDLDKIKKIMGKEGWNISICELKKRYKKLLQERDNGNKN